MYLYRTHSSKAFYKFKNPLKFVCEKNYRFIKNARNKSLKCVCKFNFKGYFFKYLKFSLGWILRM